MLTTLIYRSHINEKIATRLVEEMVKRANQKNDQMGVTGILLFNGTHFFQLLEGPEESVNAIYEGICRDMRHHNIVELMRDYAPVRRFGKYGMELFDLREYERDEVLQTVLNKGTTRYQLFYQDRALQFFRSFIEAREKENYYEISSVDEWQFIVSESGDFPAVIHPVNDECCNFAFQPIIDPLAREIVSVEALLRPANSVTPDDYFAGLSGDALYLADLHSKKLAFIRAGELDLGTTTLSVNLLPMTLVEIPDAVTFLLDQIAANGLVPEQIIVEFTEREVISRLAEFTHAVRQLKAAGISIAIDHFGAGFAGLMLLTQFQPDRIKIDRALISDVHRSGARQAVIHAILKCCQSLEIMVTAVGVEKAEEWMWLESAGIEHFQGFLFARPGLNGLPAVAWPEKNHDI